MFKKESEVYSDDGQRLIEIFRPVYYSYETPSSGPIYELYGCSLDKDVLGMNGGNDRCYSGEFEPPVHGIIMRPRNQSRINKDPIALFRPEEFESMKRLLNYWDSVREEMALYRANIARMRGEVIDYSYYASNSDDELKLPKETSVNKEVKPITSSLAPLQLGNFMLFLTDEEYSNNELSGKKYNMWGADDFFYATMRRNEIELEKGNDKRALFLYPHHVKELIAVMKFWQVRYEE